MGPEAQPSRQWQEPTKGRKAGNGKWLKPPTPYDRFMQAEGVPTFRDIGLSRLQDLPLAPWERLGGRGSFIQLDGTEGLWGMYVVEIPPRGALKPERHIYDEVYYVVSGRGTTEVWQTEGGSKQIFEWSKGSLFAIPLNAHHRVVNATSRPCLLLACTTAPIIINHVQDPDFVFHSEHVFKDRFDEDDEFYRPIETTTREPIRGLAMRKSNLLPDIVNCELPLDNRRSPGYRRIEPHMGGGSYTSYFYMFIGEHETGRYSTAHKHPAGAVLICISGKGFTHTWPSELGTRPWEAGHGDKVRRVEYEPGGMVAAAPMGGDWYHQHFGVSRDPLRLLVFLGPGRSVYAKGGRPGSEVADGSAIDVKHGGWSIGYSDEDPHVRREFRRMLAQEGAQPTMPDGLYADHADPGFFGSGDER